MLSAPSRSHPSEVHNTLKFLTAEIIELTLDRRTQVCPFQTYWYWGADDRLPRSYWASENEKQGRHIFKLVPCFEGCGLLCALRGGS